MKTALIILFATGIYFAASAQTKNITQSNGTDKGQYIDGYKEGHWILFYSDSSKKAEGNYKKNKKDGEWKEYYKNGGIMSIAIYKDGLLSFGTMKEYFENGQLKRQMKFKDRELKGNVVTRYEDGEIEEKTEYKDGHPLGTSTAYWPNRKLRWEKEYDKEGHYVKIREYYPNGKLMRTGDYDKTVTGSLISYDEKGNIDAISKLQDNKLILEEKYYGNGKLKKSISYSPDKDVDYRLTKQFNPDGSIMQTDTIKNGRTVGKALYTEDRIEYYRYNKGGYYEGKFISYYKNDKNHTVAEEGYYNMGYKTGDWKSYYPNARLRFEGSYLYDTIAKRGMATGTHKYYFDDGTVEKVEYYEIQKEASRAFQALVSKSLKTGTWVTYYKDGTINEKVTYTNNLKNGLYELFDVNGKPKWKRSYKDDNLIGIEEEYYDGGILSHVVTRNANGYKNGPEKKFYLNGKSQEITNYNEGRQEGAYEAFYENGRPRTKGFYEFAVKTGKWMTWSEDGTLFSETLYDAKEPKYSTTYYYKDGKTAAFAKGNVYEKNIETAIVYVNGEVGDALDYYKLKKEGRIIDTFEIKESNGILILTLSTHNEQGDFSSITTGFPNPADR